MTYPPPYEQQPNSSPPTTPYPAYLGPPTPPPRKSNGPILAVVIALAVLLVGGAVTAVVLLANTGDKPNRVALEPTRVAESPVARETGEPTPDPGYSDGSGDSGDGKGPAVVYEVTGDGPVSIVFLKEDGLTPERATDADLPWRKELTMSGEARLITVTAIRGAEGDGSVTCRLTLDGKEVAKKTAKGTFATATCSKLIL